MNAKTTDTAAAKPHYAVRNFKDAGTERAFTKGKMPDDVDAGMIANYVAAGLVSTEKPKDDEAAKPAA